MNPFIRKIGFGVLLATLFLPLHSCGLGEDSRDEDNRYVYLRFAIRLSKHTVWSIGI